MFRHQFMFVISCSALLLTFAYADNIPIASGNHDIGTMKTPIDLKSMMTTVLQTVMKHTLGNHTGPLSFVNNLHETIASAKNYEKEMYDTYEEMLNKKGNFEELYKKVNGMASTGSTEEIKQKLIKVQATAATGFQKLKEFKNMKEDVNRAIHEVERTGNEFIAFVNKTFLSVNSLLLGNGPDTMTTLSSMPVQIGDAISKFFSAHTYAEHSLVMLEKLRNICHETKENINLALKELQEVEAAQKPISEIKGPHALGVKDAQGSIIKDSTFVPSLISNFACFAGLVMLTVMSANYL